MLLRRGDRGDPVRDVQKRLARAGFSSAPDPDGDFAEGTEAALLAFQESRDLRVDGICGPQSWSALVEAGYSLGDRLLYLRSPMLRGDDVAELQTRLGALGFDTGRVDGIFGPETEAALYQFQRNVGLTPDGIFGKASAEALRRLGTRGGGPALIAEVKERVALRSGARSLSGRRFSIGHSGDLAPLAHELARRLRLGGAEVILTDDPDGSRQATTANSAGSEAHISLASSLDLKGSSTLYYRGYRYESPGGRHLAQLIQETLDPWLEGDQASTSGMSLPVLRETRMPAVVCELGPPEEIGEKTIRLVESLASALQRWVEESWD